MTSQSNNFYLTILNLLKEGKNPSKISKEIGISKQRLSYYTRELKKQGYIIKKGYGVWEVKTIPIGTLNPLGKKEIRGHAFIWTIKVPKEIQGSVKLGRYFLKNHKVWVYKKSIVIYESKSFYGKNSIESRKYAVNSLLEVLQALERELGVNLKPYVFKPCREHYGQIKNDLARQCNKNNEKIIINDNLEGDWLWIDDSESLGELETGGTKAIVRSKQVQTWFNDHKKHNFEVTPTFILNSFNQMFAINNQLKEQIQSHLKLIQEYRRENIRWRKETESKIVKENKEQKRLADF